MEIPGLTIFQGGGSIQLNNSANHIEEQEAIEDQKRRDEELKNELQNAFDDLIDDEDLTIDSSSNLKSQFQQNEKQSFSNFLPPNKNNEIKQFMLNEQRYNSDEPNNNNLNFKKIMDENEHLKSVIAAKNNELENLSKLLQEEKKKCDDLNKNLAICEAEKCRAQMSKQQTHELLVESKAKYSELEDSNTKLKAKMKSMEDSNTKLQEDLERTRLMLSEIQQKYHMVEKNAGFNAERKTDVLLKQANDRYNAQIEIMQQQLQNLRSKFEDKERDFNSLDIRYKELQRNREAMLVEKSETINQLAKSLEESQQRCQKLMTNIDFAEENASLKRVINSLEQQSEYHQKTINDLLQRLDSTTAELALMDSVLHENIDSDVSSPKRINFTKQNLVGSTPLTTNDRLERLKSELYRSVATQKSKREEIKKLNSELEEKNSEIKMLQAKIDSKDLEFANAQKELKLRNDEIKLLKEEENKALVSICTLKEEKLRLENRVKILQNELDEISNNNKKCSSCEIFKEQLNNSKLVKQNLEKELEKLRKNYEQLSKSSSSKHNEQKLVKLDVQLKNLNIDLEELKQENESLKTNYEIILKENQDLKERKLSDSLRLELERHKFLLKDAKQECDRVKNLYVDICNTKDNLLIELEQLKSKDIYKELHEEKEKCANLQRAIQLTEMKCSEVKKILEIEKTNHENEIQNLKEKLLKEKSTNAKVSNSPLNCSKCFHHSAEITKLEISNIKLENQCAIYHKQISELQEQISQSNALVEELNDKIKLNEDQEKIIADLKEKAHQFEEYIESCRTTKTSSSSSNQKDASSNTTSGVSSPKTSTVCNKSVETTPELEKITRRDLETTLRNEMAKIYANELKAMEECFKIRLKQLEDENISLKCNLQQIQNELKLRQNEVQLLKYTVMSERQKFEEILKEKDNDGDMKVKKYIELLHKCREELKMKHERVKELIKELEDRNVQIENERQSMKAVMKQWEASRTESENKEAELLKNIDELKNEHSKIIDSWKAKYESAKKTAHNYKIYSEEKEQHLKKEYERMKAEFELYKTKLQNKFHDLVEKKINLPNAPQLKNPSHKS